MINLLLLALAPTFFVMALGYGAGRTGNINNMHVAELNTVVMSYCLPASLFVATASSRWSELIGQWPILLSLAVVMMGGYLLWYAYQRYGRRQDSSESALQSLAVAQPNFAAAAFPVITALFGASHLSTVAVGIAVGSLMPSPLTLALLELDQSRSADAGPTRTAEGPRRTAGPSAGAQVADGAKIARTSGWGPIAGASRHALTKPIVLAPVFGTLVSLSGWRLPAFVSASLREIGVAAGGMGLLVTGLVLSESRFRLTLNTLVGVVLSNVVQPVLAFAICRAVDAPTEITKLAVVMAALPSGFFGILFGNSYQRISSEANSTIIASTIFSALTLAATIGWTYSYRG